jgi:hypothetical protein
LNTLAVPNTVAANGTTTSEVATMLSIYNISSGCSNNSAQSASGWKLKAATPAQVGLPATITAPLHVNA